MNKYNHLLNRVADEFSILRGDKENSLQWKVRLIYSVIGRMAIASLYDIDEEESISITHLKRRVENLLRSYKVMYPEVNRLFTINTEEFSSEIYDIYLHTGCIYHAPNRIVMSAKSSAAAGDIQFTRGYMLDEKQMLSGLGTYKIFDHAEKTVSVSDMFLLEEVSLKEKWNRCISRAKWIEFYLDNDTEYLRVEPPFSRGYWVNKPDTSGEISILRTGYRGSRLYYLYKFENEKIMASQLPQWEVEDYCYRVLAIGCLANKGNLPSTTYKCDGDIVYINFGYLPPPAELYLWKLYSWPASLLSLPKDFSRVCVRKVFEAIKKIMVDRGYRFEEVDDYVKWS